MKILGVLGEEGVANGWECPNTPSHTRMWSLNMIRPLISFFLPKIHRKETNTIGLLSEYFVYSEKVCILYVIEEAKN